VLRLSKIQKGHTMRDTFDHEAKAWNDSIDRNDTYIDDDYLEYDAGWICPICNK